MKYPFPSPSSYFKTISVMLLLFVRVVDTLVSFFVTSTMVAVVAIVMIITITTTATTTNIRLFSSNA